MNIVDVKENVKFHDNKYYYDRVRRNIRKYRRRAGLTQQELAELIDVSRNYVAQIEIISSNKFFTIHVLGKIADALNVDISKFFEETDYI